MLIEKAKNGEDTKRNLAHIAVIGSYVKRCGNLLLLAAENKSIPSEELARSLRESIDNLKLLDIDAAIDEKGSGNIPLENAVRAFCLYEAAIEPVLDRMSAIYVRLFVNNVGFRLSLQLGVDDDVSEADFSCLLECEDVSIELDDGTLYVDVSMGGESKL